MQNRHRLPTIFSIYMVDVLCCALGCVILLWLIKVHEARNQARATDRLAEQHQSSSSRLASVTDELEKLRKINLLTTKQKKTTEIDLRDALAQIQKLRFEKATIDALRLTADEKAKATKEELLAALKQAQALRFDKEKLKKLAAYAQQEHKKTKDALSLALDQLADLRLDYKTAKKSASTTTGKLEDTVKKNTELAKQIAVLNILVRDAKKKLDATTAKNKADEKQLKLLTAQLLKSDLFTKDLQKQLDSLEIDAKKFKTNLTLANKDAVRLAKELTKREEDLKKAQERLAKLALVEKALSTKLNTAERTVSNLKEAAKNRFAGIELTGKRVLFLVDMSGSMLYKDLQKAKDPDKWPLVCETVAKIMRSLPNLERYQVILFSNDVRYPMADRNKWLDYYPKYSAGAVLKAMKAVEPAGETDMYKAFQEAFRFRAAGLDTIYVLSDGLPTTGEGLPQENEKLTEIQKSNSRAKYVRAMIKQGWNRRLAGIPQVRINTIGYFFDSPEVGSFLWALARENNGSFVGMNQD